MGFHFTPLSSACICRRPGLVLALLLLARPVILSAQLILPDMVVTVSRTGLPTDEVPFTVTKLAGEELRASPASTLDGVLRSAPGFSLFRRSDSFSANPTAQGVSLRGLGPSGASRSLVLLDGVPLNDPFGGWVAWSKVPRESLAGAEIVRGGGATAWGNAALGGIVQLLTGDPTDAPNRLAATIGEFATRSVEGSFSTPLAGGSLQLLGRDFQTDGFPLVAPEDRGPLDQAASSDHRWLAGRWQQTLASGLTLGLNARTYRENRNNGTPLQTNSTREDFASVTLATPSDSDFSWNAILYGQDQRFASSFSAVDATRSTETPASDQFAVPATGLGAAWTGSWKQANGARTNAGVDYRRVRGETREHYLYTAGAFTRQREAGGTQDITGAFVMHQHPLAPSLHGTLGGRLDFWRDRDGHRREFVRATGADLRNDTYPDQDGMEFSPGAGLVWTPAPDWWWRASAQHSFRRPTLNELYRPFRVGNVITEANASLKTEQATSAELGVEYSHEQLTLGAVAFWNDLRDAVGNVTLVEGPGNFPIVGFIPAGGLGRQRLNLDRIRVQGVELSARWQASSSLSLSADYLYNDATVLASALAPDIVGRRLAQVPRHSATIGANWHPVSRLTLTPRVRALGRQFEDDQNQLRLGAVLVVDLGISFQLNPKCALTLSAENLTDRRIETGRSPDGLVNTGTPRLILGGIRCQW